MFGYGVFGTYLIGEQLKSYMGEKLPSLNNSLYKCLSIENDNDVNTAFEYMKSLNNIINKNYEDVINNNIITIGKTNYEDESFLLLMNFNKIFDYYCDFEDAIYYSNNMTLMASFDNLLCSIYEYLDNEISTDELKYKCAEFFIDYQLVKNKEEL